MLGASRKFSQKVHYEEDIQANHLRGGVLDLNSVPDDTKRSLAVENIGKLHFDPKYGGDMSESNGKKIFEHRGGSKTMEPRGKRFIGAARSSMEMRPGLKKQIPEASLRRSEESDEIAVNWKHMRNVRDETGALARLRPSKEFNMERSINRKQRGEFNDTTDRTWNNSGQRNAIYTAGFHKRKPGEGGKMSKFEASLATTGGAKLKTYAEKEAERKLQYDLDCVAQLTNDSKRLGRKVPSWEERTGFYLVQPEDEAY